MPEDTTRVTYDENGGKVTKIPKGTPKEEMEAARKRGDKTINDPEYNSEDAAEDAELQEEDAEKKNSALQNQASVNSPKGKTDGYDNTKLGASEK